MEWIPGVIEGNWAKTQPFEGDSNLLVNESDIISNVLPESGCLSEREECNPKLGQYVHAQPFVKSFRNTSTVGDEYEEDLPLEHGESSSEFKSLYFSKTNLLCCSRRICFEVQRITKTKLAPQDPQQILAVMKGIFGERSVNPTDSSRFLQEVRRLDDLVIGYCVERIVSAIDSQRKALIDFNNPMNKQLPLPLTTSSYGDNKIKDVKSFLAPIDEGMPLSNDEIVTRQTQLFR